MKKRFLTADNYDTYDEIPYNRLHRNLTRDAIEFMDDEDSDILDDLSSKVKCPRKRKWDNRYCTKAASRWLKSNVGKPWNKIRQAFMDFTGGKGEHLVEENTCIIDGVLNINGYCGPTPIDNTWGETFYVDQNGILQYKPKKKYTYAKKAPKFLIIDKMIWFRRDNNSFFYVPFANVKFKMRVWLSKYYYRTYVSDTEFAFEHYQSSHTLSPMGLKDGYVEKREIKQASKKDIPQEAYNLGFLDE